MAKPWGTCKECDVSFAACADFLEHHCLGPLPADWHEPRAGTRRAKNAQWSDADSVVVDVNPDPNCPSDVRVRYVGSHAAKVKAGYERVHLRSLPEVNKFEREHQVMNHRMHFDNNGRALDDKYRDEVMNH